MILLTIKILAALVVLIGVPVLFCKLFIIPYADDYYEDGEEIFYEQEVEQPKAKIIILDPHERSLSGDA